MKPTESQLPSYTLASRWTRLFATVILAYVAMQCWLIATTGQSVGKLFCNIKVVDKNSGSVPNVVRLIMVRAGASILISMLGGFCLAAPLMLLFSSFVVSPAAIKLLQGNQYFLVAAIVVLGIFSLASQLDVLFIFRKDRRCLHDLVAGTAVIVSETESHGQ